MSAPFIATSGTTTADGTEQTLAQYSKPGIYQLGIDCTNLISTETFKIKVYKMVKTGGSAHLIQEIDVTGVVAPPVRYTDLFNSALTDSNNIKFTMQQTSGTNRAFDWEVLQF